MKKTIYEMKYKYRNLSDRSVKQSCVEAAALVLKTVAGSEKHRGGKRSVELG